MSSTTPKSKWTLKLNPRQLLDAHAKIVAQLEEQGYSEIEVDADYYWAIMRERLYDVHARPSEDELTIGQLSEDNDWIQGIRGGGPVVVNSLVWLSTLLRAYGEFASGTRRSAE